MDYEYIIYFINALIDKLNDKYNVFTELDKQKYIEMFINKDYGFNNEFETITGIIIDDLILKGINYNNEIDDTKTIKLNNEQVSIFKSFIEDEDNMCYFMGNDIIKKFNQGIYEIPKFDAFKIVELILQKAEDKFKFLPFEDKSYESDLKKLSLILAKVEFERLKYLSQDKFDKMLDVTKIINYYEKYDYKRDLLRIIEKNLKSLDYLNDEELKQEYTDTLSKDNITISDLENIIKKYNNKASEVWKNYCTSITDFKQGEPFAFIVHNLTHGKINGDFKTKYVSCSLITNEQLGLFGTHQVGFIMPPTDIISALFKDTYTYNYKNTNSFNKLFNNVPPVALPQEIIDINKKQTNEELLNYSNSVIYNEIVKNEFNPIGIFYYDNSEYNYEMALKLQKEYSLPIVKIDYNLYKDKLNKTHYTK